MSKSLDGRYSSVGIRQLYVLRKKQTGGFLFCETTGVTPRPVRQGLRRHKGLQTVCIIRIDSSCGYACFWGLLGCLAGVWGVFEVVLQVPNLVALDWRVARADLFVT